MRRTPALLATAAIGALLLIGCTPEPAPSPSASVPAPVFASEEEALAAAEAAYGAYLETVDQIFADGGTSPERLRKVATESVVAHEAPGFESLREQQLYGMGRAEFSIAVQQYSADGFVSAYVCEDISNTDVVDVAGVSQVLPGRVTEFVYVVEFEGVPLLVAGREPWTGGGICD